MHACSHACPALRSVLLNTHTQTLPAHHIRAHPCPSVRHVRYTPYEGLNLANQNNRKLEVFGRKLEETSKNCIDILINISENETILFN